MKSFLIKLPEGMLERWRETAKQRGTSLAQMIREAVNRDIDSEREKDGPRTLE